jgi:hypothetical protein
LEISRGKVTAFSYFSTVYDFSCDVSASRGDRLSKWSETGKTTMISFEEGNAAITRSGNTYTIQFIDVSHMLHCGMRGQLADQITIVRRKKECDVR